LNGSKVGSTNADIRLHDIFAGYQSRFIVQVGPSLIDDRTILRTLIVLAITQLIGWGTIGLTAVIGRQVAADIDLDLALVFAGTSVLYLAMGVCSPLLARPFSELGARRVMVVGTAVSAAGFAVLSATHGPAVYFAAWLLLGVGGSASLSTAAYIVLNEVAGQRARSAIGALMLVTGLSSTLFWPTTSWLVEMLGWRGTCLTDCVVLLSINLPLEALALPTRKAVAESAGHDAAARATPAPARSTFYLLVLAITLNAFVTIGMSAVLIELFKAEGLPVAEALAFASSLGVIQVSARAIDFVGGGRWDGLTTGLVAGSAVPLALLLLMLSGASHGGVMAFLLIYGTGSGALAVARATMPLVFYDKVAFAKATSRIALPLNVLSAVSAPILVALLTRFGSNALLGLALLCSSVALGILLLLRRRRPGAVAMT
jgi:MFS family permease